MTVSFKRHYIFLGLLLITGLLVALATLIGLDRRIGWIAAGFTIGVQVAIHMQRSAELRINRVVRDLSPADGQAHFDVAVYQAPAEPAPLAAIEEEQQPAVVPATVVELSAYASEAPQVAPVAAVASATCACACGCEQNSNGGFEGLCADCRSSRLQESLACECDYSETASCTCGVIKHWPDPAELDLVAAG